MSDKIQNRFKAFTAILDALTYKQYCKLYGTGVFQSLTYDEKLMIIKSITKSVKIHQMCSEFKAEFLVTRFTPKLIIGEKFYKGTSTAKLQLVG